MYIEVSSRSPTFRASRFPDYVSTLVPRTANEVTDAIRWAAAEGETLEVLAGATRRALGRLVEVAARARCVVAARCADV